MVFMAKKKMKTHRGAAKRLWVSGTGKIMRMKAGKTHKLEVKTAKRKRKLRQAAVTDPTNVKNIRKLIPYK